jgi:hypothetical protein
MILKKTVAINLFVLIALLLLIETTSFFVLKIFNKGTEGFFIILNLKEKNELKDPCKKYMTHPILSHIHDHNNQCKIRDGYASGEFIFYFEEPIKDEYNFIVTLGGSTTDGFMYYLSDGYTWPNLLSNEFNKQNKNYKIINGGTGGYNSSLELLKLITEVENLDLNIKYVVSLNGINEMKDYLIKSEFLTHYPYFTNHTLKIFNNEQWIKIGKNKIKIMPNFIRFIYHINLKFVKSDSLSKIYEENRFKINQNKIIATNSKFDKLKNNPADIWLKNIKLMKSFSNSQGWKYIVFLQPTMGLSGPQSLAPVGTNDEIILNSLSENKNYLDNLNDLYGELKVYCNKLKYCYDISDLAPPKGNNYKDPRHHNSNGNKIIAYEIFKTLQRQMN